MFPLAVSLILMLLLLLLCVPVAVAIGISTFVGLYLGDIPLELFTQRAFANFDSFPLMAVPFFILAGDIMRHGTLAASLLDFCKVWFGHLRGALCHITVITNLFYGALCGSASASLAAVGSIMIPAMEKEGYSLPFATVLNAVSCNLAIMIPPSIALILYGSFAGVSVTNMFIATIVPGCVFALVIMGFGMFFVVRNGYGIMRVRSSWSARINVLKNAKWAFGMPIIVLGSIYAGITTPTEAGAIAVLYCLLVERFVSRTLNFRLLIRICMSTLRTLGMFFCILMVANAFGTMLMMFDAQDVLIEFMQSLTQNALVFLTVLCFIFVALGTFVEGTCILVVLTPLMVPVAVAYGINPVHFGIFMLFSITLGALTPPVGTSLFLACSISGCNILSAARVAVPFVLAQIAATLLIAYFPVLSLCLL